MGQGDRLGGRGRGREKVKLRDGDRWRTRGVCNVLTIDGRVN